MSLQVCIVQGWDLMKQDTSSSDPYVIVKDFETMEEIGRTEVQESTLKPVWHCKFDLPDNTRCLLLEVVDRDIISSDDPMGSVRVPLPRELSTDMEVSEQDAWYTLTQGPPGFRGSLRVKFSVADAENPGDPTAPPLPPGAESASPMRTKRRTSVPAAAYLAHSPEFQQMFGSFGTLKEFPKMEEMQFDIPLVKRGGQDESALITGRLLFTSHRIAFLQSAESQSTSSAPPSPSGAEGNVTAAGVGSPAETEFQQMQAPTWVPLAAILEPRLEKFECRESRASLAALEVTLKDSRSLKFSLLPDPATRASDAARVQKLERIVRELKWFVAENTFAFARRPPQLVQPVRFAMRPDTDQPPPLALTMGEPQFDMVRELAALGIADGGSGRAAEGCRWRVTTVNTSYELCPTYPHVFAVPASISDETLKAASKFRFKQRVPAVTWHNPRTGAVLCRSAQPLHDGVAEMVGRATPEDDELLQAIRACASAADSTEPSKLYVYDARPKLNAEGNKLKGGGFEDVHSLGGASAASIDFMGIGNIHVMRHSLRDLGAACGSLDGHNFFDRLHSSGWLYHVASVLRASAKMALQLDAGAPLLVHCSDGWDRTSQLAATSQLLLVPRYRTRQGFAALMEKDWCAFGHMCAERCGFGHSNEFSPIILQWLDCVWQLLRQFPAAFEFNENMLLFIVDALYSNWWGNFLGNNEKQRRLYRTVEDCESVWECIRLNWELFQNDSFVAAPPGVETQLLKPSCDVRSLRLWDALYMKELEVVLRIKAKQQGMLQRKPEVPEAALTVAPKTTHILAPRKDVVVPVQLERPATIWWRFNVDTPGNTLFFCLRDTAEGREQEVIESTRTECRQEVVNCKDLQAGQYELVWSNPESLVKSKTLNFAVFKAEL